MYIDFKIFSNYVPISKKFIISWFVVCLVPTKRKLWTVKKSPISWYMHDNIIISNNNCSIQ